MGIAKISSGNTGGGFGKGGAGSTTTIPATSDPYSTTYGNPYAIGLSSVSTSFAYSSTGVKGSGFGQPVYAVSTTTGNTTSLGSTNSINNQGFNTLNYPKAPHYTTVLSNRLPLIRPAPVQLQGELLGALERSDFLKDKKTIALAVNGSTVFLKGQVADPDERRIVEGFVRMTPGVRDVVNELVVPPMTSKQ